MIANPTPEDLDGQTVRDYGSPMRHFPGERTDNDVRQGSINTSTDYLPTADGVTGRRYATNADEALVLQLQAAVLLNNFSLRTSVVDIVPQPEPGYPDRVVFTLQHTYIDGRREIKRVVTDRWIAGQGSGGPSYGFDLRGSSAEGVLAANAQISGFPKLSDTLTAFTKLASNEQDQPELGEVVVIYGSGNSTDTLLEYIGGLFSGSNRGVRNIRKVYVVATKPLNPRPRYADNKDLQPRAGQALGSLLEFVDARVGDVDFADQRRDTDTKLRLFDTDGNELRDRQGRPIRADNVISAAGFRPDSDPVFARLTGGRSLRDPGVLEAVTLPTNPNITVGDRIAGYNGGLFIGTGSRPGFDVLDKLAQLPPSSREALIRNGAENAVAIGFRGPDTQAAVRLFLDDVPEIVPSSDISAARQRTITQRDIVSAGQTSTFRSAPLASSPAPRRRDIVADSSVLSPLLLRPLADIRFPDAGRQTYRYRIALDANSRQLNITSLTNAPYALVDALAQACTDPYFVTYAQAAQANRRGSTSIDVTLEIRNGRISPRFSFAQPN